VKARRDEGLKAQNILRIASAGVNAQTVTIGEEVYELTTRDDLAVTAGRKVVDVTGGDTVKAQGKITMTDVPTADDTVTIGGKVYTFKAAIVGDDNVDGYVKIGAGEEETIANLVAAINRTPALAGTAYAVATAKHSTVTAEADGGDCIITAIVGGTPGNAITLDEDADNTAKDAAVLGTETLGVDPSAEDVCDALLASINLNTAHPIVARKISANELQILADRVGVLTLACTETLTGTNNAWAAAAMYGGRAKRSRRHVVVSRVPTAVEVALGNMHFELSFTPSQVIVRVKPTATPNAAKAHDGGVTIDGTHVTVDNAGSTDWATTDTIEVLAFE
jgi:hypothetical protein